MLKKTNHKKQVLVVEDDPSTNHMLSMVLQTHGYQVTIATTSQEAFQNASQVTDLILLDILLSGEDGFKVCEKLKTNSQTRHIPVMIISSRASTQDVVEALHLGADDYLVKPFEYEELLARMEAVLRRSSLFTQDHLLVKEREELIQELRKIIDEERIVPFFQPIFLFNQKNFYGLEILSRPQTSSKLSSPELLFKFALKLGLYYDLEILSWRKALEYIAPLIKNEKLFFNCNPYLIEGPRSSGIKDLFERFKVDSQNVYLEITERSAISDFKYFFEHLKSFRDHGIKFVVDDLGGGYASLESIVEIHPEAVKIDRHIIAQLDKDEFKRSIVKFIVSFCKENRILSIAEGIETEETLKIVKELGVDGGQGYYLYKPVPNPDLDKIR